LFPTDVSRVLPSENSFDNAQWPTYWTPMRASR
jgi:hypothetical protein